MKIHRKVLIALNVVSLVLAATLIVVELRILVSPGQASLEPCSQCGSPARKSSLNTTI